MAGNSKPPPRRKTSTATVPSDALKPPPGGAAVRMYRIGHDDCFLIAFDGESPGRPTYVLIDCGYKSESPGKLAQPTKVKDLVLAFELSPRGKVLLFVGDAQAGNWRSWSEDTFDDEGREVTTEDLLGRTVLYKVGHHGSHNATLKGKAGTHEASLAIMAQGKYAPEFVAMITAVEAWAHQKPKPDWNHPLPAIKQALLKKAGGRVLQTDTSLPDKPFGDGASSWQAFLDRVRETPLYFDLIVQA
jgi:hypothetical protein